MTYHEIGWSSNVETDFVSIQDRIRYIYDTAEYNGTLDKFQVEAVSWTDSEYARGAIFISSTRELVAQTAPFPGVNADVRLTADFGPSSIVAGEDYIIAIWGDENVKFVSRDTNGPHYWYDNVRDYSQSGNGNFSLYLDPLDQNNEYSKADGYSLIMYATYQEVGVGTAEHPYASHRSFPYLFTTDTYSNPIEGFWLGEEEVIVPHAWGYDYDLAIYYGSLSGNNFVDCRCSRWDIQNYSVVVETWLKEDQLALIRENTRPGAVGELYTILGRPRYYDKTWDGSNTLRLLPTPSSNYMNDSTLNKMRKETLIYPKNITTHPIQGSNGWIGIKIEGMISGTSSL